jgi:hypothetical protein
MAAVGKVDQPLNDAPAVRSSVDVVAQGDDAVVRAGSDRFEQGIERRRTAVDVTESDSSWVHGGAASSRAAEFLCELAGNITQLLVEYLVDPTDDLIRSS